MVARRRVRSERVRSHRARPRGRIAAALLVLVVARSRSPAVVSTRSRARSRRGSTRPTSSASASAAARAEVAQRARRGRRAGARRSRSGTARTRRPCLSALILAQDPPGATASRRRVLLVVRSASAAPGRTSRPSPGSRARAAYALARAAGFTPTRRYAPSTEIAPGTWSRRPGRGNAGKAPRTRDGAGVDGPAKRAVPSLDGLDAERAAEALEGAGFSPASRSGPTRASRPGPCCASTPRPARAPLGSTVTLVVAREPRWEAVDVDRRHRGRGAAAARSSRRARGSCSRPTTHRRSASGAARSTSELGGDAEGDAEVDAGDTLVLADVSDADRTIEVSLDVDGSVHWSLAVQVEVANAAGRRRSRRRLARRPAVARTAPERRALRRSTAFVWSWETRDSVTPSTSPISRSVSSS